MNKKNTALVTFKFICPECAKRQSYKFRIEQPVTIQKVAAIQPDFECKKCGSRKWISGGIWVNNRLARQSTTERR